MSGRLFVALLVCGAFANAANVCHSVAEATRMPNHFPDDRTEARVPVGGKTISRSFHVLVKAGGPEFLVTVRAFPMANGPTHPVRTGEIEIARCEDGKRQQILPVIGWQEIGLGNFRTFDINFDGYLDLSVLVEVGSTYSNQEWWIYDSASGQFIQNRLTRQLRNISSNEYSIDPKKHEITFSNILATCPALKDRRRIEENGLVTVHEERAVQGTPCVVKFFDRAGGAMKLTAVRRFIDDKPVK